MRNFVVVTLIVLCFMGCKQRSVLHVNLATSSGACLEMYYPDNGTYDSACSATNVYKALWDGDYDVEIGVSSSDSASGYYILGLQSTGALCTPINFLDVGGPIRFFCTIAEPRSTISIIVGK